MCRFSSSVVPSTSRTCRSQVLPTMVTTGACESSRALRQVSSAAATPLRRVMPKAATLAWLQRQLADLLEILEVLGVGERIAALDEIDAQFVEPAGDEQLVLQREVDAFALAAVAQRGVVDVDACHNFGSGVEDPSSGGQVESSAGLLAAAELVFESLELRLEFCSLCLGGLAEIHFRLEIKQFFARGRVVKHHAIAFGPEDHTHRLEQ